MFCLPAGAKYPFFRLQRMDYIRGCRKFHTALVCFFITFLVIKKAFKRPFDLLISPTYYWILLICVSTVQNQGKYTHLSFYVVDVSRSAEGRVFLFSCETLRRGLKETIVSSFLKFSTSTQNDEFQIHRSQMEIGLYEMIKFCTRKLIKRTHFMSPLKMINLFQDAKLFPLKLWALRFQDLQFLWLIGHSWSPKITNLWGSK